MGFYQRHVLPRLIHVACGLRGIERHRAQVVPAARGEVLELGFGSGLNLPHYDRSRVSRVWALEPAEAMRGLAGPRIVASGLPVQWLAEPAEALSLPAASVDTVVSTFTLCTVADAGAALAQVRRVLRPGGQLLFCEHGAAPDAGVRRWQHRLDGAWGRLAGGCHLNRDVAALLGGAGFALEGTHAAYLKGAPRLAGYLTWGQARVR
jgi:ubiquinone/menaquinone biosynthesis C-methylase UbiE